MRNCINVGTDCGFLGLGYFSIRDTMHYYREKRDITNSIVAASLTGFVVQSLSGNLCEMMF